MERLLRLMQYLSSNVNYSIDELSEKLGISVRSLYRYLDSFKAAGFAVQRISEGVYRMGLLDQVEILEGEPLRCYVLEKCRGQEARYFKPLNR